MYINCSGVITFKSTHFYITYNVDMIVVTCNEQQLINCEGVVNKVDTIRAHY